MNKSVLPPYPPLISRRSVLRGSAAAALSFAVGGSLAACAPVAKTSTTQSLVPAPAGTKPSGSIRLLFQGSADQQARYVSLFKLFQKRNPGVKIQAVGDPTTPWDRFFADVEVKIAGGQKFDLLVVPTEGQRLFASKKVLQPIDAWISRDKANIDDFQSDVDPKLNKWCQTLSTPDGHQYYLPYGFECMCLWYRKSIFAKAGLAEPTADWTWNDLYVAAGKLTVKDKVWGMPIDTVYFSGLEPWLLTNGTNVLNADWTKATFNTQESIDAMNFAKKFVDSGYSPKPGGTFDPVQGAINGQVAMWGSGRWPISYVQKSGLVDDFGIVPFPAGTTHGSPIGWSSVGMFKNSENKEAAWAFIKFLCAKETQDFIGETAFADVIPARRSSGTGSPSLKNSPTGTEELYKALSYGTPVPGADKGVLIQQTVQDTFKQVLTGNVDAKAAVQSANKIIENALK